MIQIIGLIWQTITMSLSWLPDYCLTALSVAGTIVGVLALTNLTIKAIQSVKG